MSGNNSNSVNTVASEVVEVNLVQLTKYFYTHRIIIAIVALLAPALVGLWTFFVNKPIFKSSVTVNINVENDTSDFQEKRLQYYFMQQDVMNKLNWAEDFFYSKSFKGALIDEIEGRTNHIDKYPKMFIYKKDILNYVFDGKASKIDRMDKGSYMVSLMQMNSNIDKNKMTISVETPSPTTSMMLADVATHLLIELNHKRLLERVTNVINFLEKQTGDLKTQLKNLENKLTIVQKKHGIVSVESVAYNVNSIDSQRTKEIAELRQFKRSNASLIKEVGSELLKAKKALSGEGEVPSYLYLAQLEKRLQLLKYQEALTKTSRMPSSNSSSFYADKIKVTQNQIKQTLKNKNSSDERVTRGALESVKELETYLAELKREQKKVNTKIVAHEIEQKNHELKLGKLPLALQSIAELERGIKMTEQLYSEMSVRLQETRVREVGRDNDMSILTRAEIPVFAAGMSVKRKMILASIMGIVLTMLMLLLRFVLIPTIRDTFDLEKYGLKVIGSVSWYRNKDAGLLGVSKRPPLVIESDPRSYEANSIYFAQFKLEKELGLAAAKSNGVGKVLSFCSVNSNEGKTFCATNLAFSLARAQYKVLVIDADFSKPDVLDYFDYDTSEKSLKTIEYANEELTFRVGQINSNLDVMMSKEGDDVYSDVLHSTSFRGLVHQLKSDYDLIILDNPPMNGHMSSLLVSQYSDSTVMVVNQRTTLSQDVYKHYKNLSENVDYPVLSILNFVYDNISTGRRSYETKKKSA